MVTEAPAKILLIDDEVNILNSIRRALVDEDIDILTAEDGNTGLEILRDNLDISVIISDQSVLPKLKVRNLDS